MEKTLIDKIASGEIHTLDLIERLRTYERKTIEEFIVELDLESVTRNDGTIEGKRAADYIQNVINIISRELKVPDQWAIYERGNDQAAQEPEQAAPQLPPELNEENTRERFLSLLQKAIDCNLCDKSYHWQGTKALLTYFCAKASNRLGLGKGMVTDSESIRNTQRPKIFWKPFEMFFGVDGMCGTEKDYKRNGNRLPLGYEKVDKIFS